MIPPQEAVSRAKKYLRDLEPEERFDDLRLEELELKDTLWLITLGYNRKTSIKRQKRPRMLEEIYRLIGDSDEEITDLRVYKRLTIDSESGEFRSMTIREGH